MKILQLQGKDLLVELNDFIEIDQEKNKEVEKKVLEMREHIRTNGFEAVCDYTKKFDKFNLTEDNILVSSAEIDKLAKKITPELSNALEIAVSRVKNFHTHQLSKEFIISDKQKNNMGQKVVPLESTAVYIPGGQALYPSTLYMSAIPAIIAGVERIALFSPPRTFEESPEVARLIQLLGIKEVYRVGGAQAVFAAAYGAGKIKPVDKIVGPGNSYVAKAKELVYGTVDIDMVAGPSEILVIADTNKKEDIPLIAADLLSQAEHGPAGWARSILVGMDEEYLMKIRDEVYRQAEFLPNTDVAVKSLDECGAIIVCKDRIEAVKVSNIVAPEHLEIFSYDPYPLLNDVRNAGSVFIGRYTPESVGDYIGGPNHVLPTSRTSRFFSPLGVYDFQKRFSWIEFNKNSLMEYATCIAKIARSEGLEAHARSAEIRFKNI